jgi:hypothetical protein
MVTVGVLGILVLFGLGILLLPKKKPEEKTTTLMEIEGRIEFVEFKKVEDIIVR